VRDARVQAAIDNWGPRLIANGVDYNDFLRTTAAISRWEEWLDAWSATAEAHRTLALEARREGHQRSAGEAFLRAAVSYHFAKFVWVLDPERNRAATEAAVRALYDAHGLLDGPGQGETGFTIDIRADYEVAVVAALDALGSRADLDLDLDLDRVGAAGVGLGGYYAARSAAFEPRIRAVAGISGPYDMAAAWQAMPALTREAFTHHSGARSETEARERAAELSLAGVAERIEQLCVVETGRLDRVIPWEQTRRIAHDAPRGEWVLYDDGTHVCNNIPLKYRPLVADWMRDQLR